MISVTKLRAGVCFEQRGEPWRVLDYKHVHLSRGSGTITVRARNLKNGRMMPFTFRSGDRVEEIIVERRVLSYLYSDGDVAVFMDPMNFEQYRLPKAMVGEAIRYIGEGAQVTVVFWENEPLDIELPPKVILEVQDASPGVKGDTVAGATKEAVTETGLQLRVPLFIKEGDRVVVDTRSGAYVERMS